MIQSCNKIDNLQDFAGPVKLGVTTHLLFHHSQDSKFGMGMMHSVFDIYYKDPTL